MSSRIRNDVEHIFECFCEVSRLKGAKDPTILRIFPEDFRNDFLKWIPDFTFPCTIEISTVQHFSFALTSLDSTWTYGFCRHEPFTEKALVIVSHFPYHDAFYELLDYVADLNRRSGETADFTSSPKLKHGKVSPMVADHLQKFYNKPLPIPQPHKLPTLPDNINLTEYYCAIDSDCMVGVLASLLHERRIMIVSRKLSRLSACVQAANQLIYPLEWQGIYIPVLPTSLKDCLLAPMPYLIGVPYPVYESLVLHDIGDVVTVNVDECTIISPFDDVASLPQEVVEDLLASLESCKNLVGDSLARAFLQTLVHLLGGIENAIRTDAGSRPHFDKEAFVNSRGSGVQPFLREMLTLQMFQQFLEGRMALVAAKAGCSDEFARECCAWEENYRRRRKWQRNPARILKTLKHKTQPAMDSAIKTVRSGNKGVKSAYKGLKHKLVVAKRTLGGSSGAIGGSEWWERPTGSQDSSFSSETIAKVQPQTLVNETTPQDLISLSPKDERSLTSGGGIVCMETYTQDEDKLLRESEAKFFSLLDSSPTQSEEAMFPSGRGDSDSEGEPTLRHAPDISYTRRQTPASLLAELLATSPRTTSKPRSSTTVCPLVLAGLADLSDDHTLNPVGARLQEDELLQKYGIDFQKFQISRQNWTKFD